MALQFYSVPIAFTLLLIAGQEVSALPSPSPNLAFTGQVELTSNYIWRGVSQSDNGPAVRANLDIAHSSGIYINTWASGVDVRDSRAERAHIEWENSIGYRGRYQDLRYDVSYAHTHYPGAYDLDYGELRLNWDYKRLFGGVAYSDDALNSGGHGIYTHLGYDYPILPHHIYQIKDLHLVIQGGVYNFTSGSLKHNDYIDGRIALEKHFGEGKYTVSLGYTDTNDHYDQGDLDDGHLVLTVTGRF